jgi:hypothetical protein
VLTGRKLGRRGTQRRGTHHSDGATARNSAAEESSMATRIGCHQWQRCRCGRRKGKGREPSTVPDKVHPSMGSGGDRRMRTVHRDRGHHVVTRSVASSAGPATCTRGKKPAWATDWWARPGYKFSFKFPIQLKFVNSNWNLSRAQKIFKLCMWLDLNILNNFLD